MFRKIVLGCLLLASTAVFAIPRLVYNGDTLEWNYSWQKQQCGTLDIKANIIEVSGIACSRVTPGYIWMESDETEKYIIATDEGGAKRAHRNRPHRTPRAAEYRRKLNTATLPNSGLKAPSTGHRTRQERTRGQGLPGRIFCGHKWR